MNIKVKLIFILLLTAMSFSGCRNLNSMEKNDELQIRDEVITDISTKNIYFAHMSVGFNIIEGIENLTEAFDFINIDRDERSGTPAFLHSIIGENGNPSLKLKEFEQKISINSDVDIAFLKFCYVDIDGPLDPEALFMEYTATFDKLEKAYPQISFVHMTMPITARQTGLKALVKRVLRMELRGYSDNARRFRFNEKMRNRYPGIFDLAKIEATRDDGSVLSHKDKHGEYYSMVPEYSDDGEHLNSKGSIIAAAELLRFLSTIE